MRVIATGLLCLLLLAASWRAVSQSFNFALQDREDTTHQANWAHPAGTDELGRDRATRIAVALLLGLAGAAAASVLASTLAVTFGSVTAFGPAWLARALLYASDLFLTLPWLFLLMLVRSALPLNLAPVRSEAITFLLLALLGAPAFLRMHHRRMEEMARSGWMLQARASGLQPLQIGRQIRPHVLPLLWTQFLLYLPACVIAEANLGTLGLGLSEPLPSLGNFLANLQSAALLNPSRLTLLPVVLLVFALAALELTLFGADA